MQGIYHLQHKRSVFIIPLAGITCPAIAREKLSVRPQAQGFNHANPGPQFLISQRCLLLFSIAIVHALTIDNIATPPRYEAYHVITETRRQLIITKRGKVK